MKAAEIFATASKGANGYTWKWRTADGKTESKQTFNFYYECLEDARNNGYVVELAQAQGNTAPDRSAGRDMK